MLSVRVMALASQPVHKRSVCYVPVRRLTGEIITLEEVETSAVIVAGILAGKNIFNSWFSTQCVFLGQGLRHWNSYYLTWTQKSFFDMFMRNIIFMLRCRGSEWNLDTSWGHRRKVFISSIRCGFVGVFLSIGQTATVSVPLSQRIASVLSAMLHSKET